MLQTRFNQFVDTLRQGMVSGFVAGLIIVFLILLGVPVNLENVALFSMLLVMIIFGVRLARRLHGRALAHLLNNALVMGVVAALLAFLLMSLINRWQTRGIDEKQYFYAVSGKTMTVLSGVPEAELGTNPERDPLTGQYPEGAKLRTNPMRLTFDSDTGLHLLKINLVIGGFYGFMLLLIFAGLLGASLTWAAVYVQIGRYRKQLTESLSGQPTSRWIVLLLPLIFFALLWLTEGQGSNGPILQLGSSSREVQLLFGFGILLWGMVALRSAQPNDWGLTYPVRLGICLGLIAVLIGLGIWRIVDNKTYFVALSSDLKESRTISAVVALGLGILLAAQNVWALRAPGRFEIQLAGTQALLALVLMPLYFDQYQNQVMMLVGIYILLGLGLNIVVGYAGLLDLGYVAFMAMGAYSYAFLSSKQYALDANNKPAGLKFDGNAEMVTRLAGWIVITVIVTLIVVYAGLRWWRQRQTVQREAGRSHTLIAFPAHPTRNGTALLTLAAIVASVIVASILDNAGLYKDFFENASPFVVGMLVGVIVAGLSGIALGIPVLSLRGDYLAIVTLGFGEIIRLLLTNLRDYTGGPQGILEIPRPLPEGAAGAVTHLWMLYLVFIGAGMVAFFSLRLKQSRIGRAWSAMRSDEAIAESMGIHLVQSKLAAFAIGAAFAGAGGVLFAARQRNIYPSDFNLEVSIQVLSLIIIGGMGSVPGVIIGAIVLIGVPEVLRELETYRILVFGALLVAMVIIRPKGLLPAPLVQLQDRARDLAHQGIYEQQQEGEQA